LTAFSASSLCYDVVITLVWTMGIVTVLTYALVFGITILAFVASIAAPYADRYANYVVTHPTAARTLATHYALVMGSAAGLIAAFGQGLRGVATAVSAAAAE